ncbi:hypothetical protein ASPBRDRAFT_27815 [Aspergillus brasiliensis CBS 101740]|uniref:Uncharacterized protein n=1 Tax=Aspergillus brasiliensis (strain CBS 101740 / IMI 381727 / IBT 21946) TaxID=767769 RepID=A0A1L9UTA5_ASPBC|nr:hypothetical protein ASPBRDRAFT_27815 [Aspergillus brasiliensis CBS 101740]
MKPLPSEIIHLIVLYLREDHISAKRHPNVVTIGDPFGDLPLVWRPLYLARYSVVSRQWQSVVESIIWKRICLQGHLWVSQLVTYTTGDDFRCARVGYIRHILWQPLIVLPRVTDPIYHTNSNDALYEWYDTQYHNALRPLFLVLQTWEEQHPGLELVFRDWSPACGAVRPRITENSSLRDILIGDRGVLPACLTATHLEDYPSLPCVRSIGVLGTSRSVVMLSSFGLIFKRLPNVRHASAHDATWLSVTTGDGRRLLRQEMIDFIHCVPQSVESLELSVKGDRECSLWLHVDTRSQPVTYLDPNGLDILSIRLHTLSMRLGELTLTHIRISKALFWPSTQGSTNASYWPNLERLQVLKMPPYNIDGSLLLGLRAPLRVEQLFQGWLSDDFSTNTPTDQREYIKSDQMGVLYQAMGQAARHMPRLQIMRLSLLHYRYRTGIESGEFLEFNRGKDARIAHLRINTQWGYQIGEEVISAWGLEEETAEQFRRTMDVTMPWYVEPRED